MSRTRALKFTLLLNAINSNLGSHRWLMLSRLSTLTELLFLPIHIQVRAETTITFVVASRNLSLAKERRVYPINSLQTVIGKLSLLSNGA